MSGFGTVLVTNDDGVDSPALVPLATALEEVATVRVVVPDGERSWSGKAMTRTTPVEVASTTRGGRTITTVSGTPADAAEVGCADACPGGPPDLVVSGINLGHNHGEAFALSSGTVGAAMEGVLLGHPAVAVSTGTMDDDFIGWTRRAWGPAAAEDWVRLAAVARAVLVDVVSTGLLATCDLVSVNLPWRADLHTPRRVTTLAATRYGAMLAPPESHQPGDGVPIGSWRPTYGGLHVPAPPPGAVPTDLQAATAGMVSITPLRLAADVPVSDGLRARMEGRQDQRRDRVVDPGRRGN